MIDFALIKSTLMGRTYTIQDEDERIFSIRRSKYPKLPLWAIVDERKEKVPTGEIESDAKLKLLASDFLFDLYNEMGLSEVDNRIALPLIDIALSYGRKTADKITGGISLRDSKTFWLRVYKVLSSIKGADEKAVIYFIPLEVDKMMSVGEGNG